MATSKEYSVRKLAENTKDTSLLYDMLDYTPISIPMQNFNGETTNQRIEQILLASGAITREQWETLKGVKYDVNSDELEDFDSDDYADSDDEFQQSTLAEYYGIKVDYDAPPPVLDPKKPFDSEPASVSDTPKQSELPLDDNGVSQAQGANNAPPA